MEFGARRFDLRGPTSCGCFPIEGRQKATNGAVRKAWTLVPYIVTILIIRADTTRSDGERKVSPPESPIFVVRDVNGFLHS